MTAAAASPARGAQTALATVRAADRPAQVVVGDVRVVDEDDRGVGHVNSHLNHGRRHQHIQKVFAKSGHHLLLVVGLHLPVNHRQSQPPQGSGRQPVKLLLDGLGVINARLVDLRQDDIRLAAFADFMPLAGGRGSFFVLFIITLAAAEVTVGLAIVVANYRNRRSVQADEFSELKG